MRSFFSRTTDAILHRFPEAVFHTTNLRDQPMNASSMNKAVTGEIKNNLSAMLMAVVFVAFLVVPGAVFAADPPGGYGDTEDKVCGFLGNINNLLNIASVVVVTIAIIFAGYQIAFAHKRIADVAPILIGGLLIGAAAQIANMLIDKDTCDTVAGVMDVTAGALRAYA
jgi:type IV secretion system protein VirB2